MMHGRSPDPEQDAVIKSPVNLRQLVEAPPGCGKTDVACARVVDLIDQGSSPSSILLLSFTRTAVREIRTRILALGKDDPRLKSVEIRTLDSFTWRLRVGLLKNEREPDVADYTVSIDRTLTALRGSLSEDTQGYLDGFSHVLIDEAQDLVGPRADLLLKFLDLLAPPCGWTVFADQAQAIYEWSEDDRKTGGRDRAESFVALLSKQHPVKRLLSKNYRTKNPEHRTLLKNMRAIVLDAKEAHKASAIREQLLVEAPAGGPGSAAELVESLGACQQDSLVLFRTRYEALDAASRLASAKLPHRLRLGRMPPVLAPWIAGVLNLIGQSEVIESEFVSAFTQVTAANGHLALGVSPDAAWWQLCELGAVGKGCRRVDVGRVADTLAIGVVPDDMAARDVGGTGVIVGTIHGSKGREAVDVLACLVPDGQEDEDEDEEARVLYVAISRARERCHVRKAPKAYFGVSPTGRQWRKTRKQDAMVEVGRLGDLNFSRTVLLSPEPEKQQNHLLVFDGSTRSLRLKLAKRNDEWTLDVVDPQTGELPLACFEQGASKDLADVAKVAFKKWGTPRRIDHVWWRDVTTVAIRQDNPIAGILPPGPWKKTRLWLAPLIPSLGLAYKPWKQ